jgi:proteasome lid subunit RPN8/RPN11
MVLQVARPVIAAITAEAEAAHPHECCGLLLGTGDSITAALPARNVHPAPARHFTIDPQTLINAHRAARGGGPCLIGYYHSHPHGPAAPSPTDIKEAAHDARVWAISAAGGIGWWRDTTDGFVPLSLAIVDG